MYPHFAADSYGGFFFVASERWQPIVDVIRVLTQTGCLSLSGDRQFWEGNAVGFKCEFLSSSFHLKMLHPVLLLLPFSALNRRLRTVSFPLPRFEYTVRLDTPLGPATSLKK